MPKSNFFVQIKHVFTLDVDNTLMRVGARVHMVLTSGPTPYFEIKGHFFCIHVSYHHTQKRIYLN